MATSFTQTPTPREDQPNASELPDGTRWNVELDDGTIRKEKVSGDQWVLVDEEVGSVSADDLTGKYPSKLRLIRSGKVVSTVDPDNTTDPVTAILNDSERGDKLVFPAYKTIQDTGPIYPRSDQTWIPNSAEVEITGDGGGIVVDGNAYGQGSNYLFGVDINGNLKITGQGPNSGQGGYAVHRQDGMAGWTVSGRLFIDKWDGEAWKDDNGSGSYQNVFSHIKINDADAGDANGVIHANGGGAPEAVHYLTVYPDDSGSGSDSDIIYGPSGPGWRIGEINIDGSAGTVVSQNTGSIHGTTIQHINYEASEQNSTASAVAFSSGANSLIVGSVTMTAGSVSHVYDSFSTDNVYWGPVRVQNGTVSTNHVNVRNAIDANATALYSGPSSQVDNGNGGSGIACLSDLTLAT